MRMKLLVAAGLGIVLAGCSHTSDKTPTFTSGTPSQVKDKKPVSETSVADKPKADTPAKETPAAGAYGLTGNGVQIGEDGQSTTVNLVGQVEGESDTGSNVIKGSTPLFKLSYSGAELFKGKSLSTRKDGGAEYGNATRFLMSDQSVSSKDAPTAFGLLIDKSTATQFAAAGLYGGKVPTNVPASGSANYNGKFAGALNSAAGSQAHLSGKFNLAADFGAGTVKGNVSELSATQFDATKPAGADLSTIGFDGALASDKTTYTATNITVGGNALGAASGHVEGGFYNTNASETAGVLNATIAGPSPTTVVGAFQGTKQP